MDPFVRKPVGKEILFSQLGPIFADVPNVSAIWTLFDSPPVSPAIADWPQEMVPPWELEEEE